MADYNECTDFASLAASLKKTSRPSTLKVPCKEDAELFELKDVLEEPKIEHTTESEASGGIDSLYHQLPLREHTLFKHHSKEIACLAYDPSCKSGRIISGGSEGLMNFIDFTSLDHSLEATKCVQFGEAPIKSCSYSQDGRQILVTTKVSPPMLLNSTSGKLTSDFCKGDRYVMDQRKTKGHSDCINSAKWHPNASDKFITGGADGTVRLWNVEQREQERLVGVIQREQKKAEECVHKSIIGSVEWIDANSIAAGSDDGVVRVFTLNSSLLKPTLTLNMNKSVVIADMKLRDNLLYLRTLDNIVIFDIRNHTKAYMESPKLPTFFEGCNMAFVNDYILTGTSYNPRQSKKGSLCVLDRNTLEISCKQETEASGVNSVLFDPLINQISVGLSTGHLVHYYDMKDSQKGILLLHKRHRSKNRQETFLPPSAPKSIIFTPYSQPAFSLPDQAELLADPLNLRRLKDRLDNSARPAPPVTGQGFGGRLGSGPNATYMRSVLLADGFDRTEDPRESLLRYAEISEKDPRFVTPAYRETQPDALFDFDALEKERKREEGRREERESAKKTRKQ